MKIITLTESQQLELIKLKKQYQAKHKVFRKLRCIELRSNGIKPKQVAEQLEITNDTICLWCNIFEKEGLE
jgi:transposase